jgi:hypothetical protein
MNRLADLVLQQMRHYNLVSSFDEQPMSELNSEAINFRPSSEFFRPDPQAGSHLTDSG